MFAELWSYLLLRLARIHCPGSAVFAPVSLWSRPLSRIPTLAEETSATRCYELSRFNAGSFMSLLDRVLVELEGRLRNLLVRILVTIGEARQAADPHHDDRVAGTNAHPWGCGRNGNVEAELVPHGRNSRGMRRIDARLDTLGNPLGNLLDRQLAPNDLAVTGEHGIGESKTKECLHVNLHNRMIAELVRIADATPLSGTTPTYSRLEVLPEKRNNIAVGAYAPVVLRYPFRLCNFQRTMYAYTILFSG